MNGGTLNLLGLLPFWTLETNGKNYVCSTILPSTHKMQLAFEAVEQVGATLAPYSIVLALPNGEGSEGIHFDYEKMMRLIFKSFELDNAALEKSISIDGVTLTHFLSHVMAGFKIEDRGVIDPITKKPLY